MRYVKTGKILWAGVALALISLWVVLFSQPSNQEDQKGQGTFVSHEQFLASTQKATFAEYARKPGAKVANEKEFAKMRNHILSMYEGVIVKNGFEMDKNGFVDCIDAKTQPSLRRGGTQLKLKEPPKAIPTEERPQERKAQGLPPMLSPEKKDRFGNVMYCEPGFVPLRRITLDELTRFETLEDYFNKFGKAGTSGLPQGKGQRGGK